MTGFKDLHKVIRQPERELAEQTLAKVNQHYNYYYTLEGKYLTDLSDWKVTTLKNEMRKKLLDGQATFTIDHPFIQYECTDNEVLNLLTEKQATQSRLIRKYLEKSARMLSEHLQKLQFQRQYAKELAENEQFQREEEITQTMQKKRMKTITVTYQVLDKELAFKMRNIIDSSRDYFSSYGITKKKKRDAYDILTREATDLLKTKQISYGREVLYAG